MNGFRTNADAGQKRLERGKRRCLARCDIVALLVLIANVFGPVGGQAQDQPETERIGYADALRIALDRSVALERSENQVEQAGIQVASAKAAFLPSITLSMSGSQNFGRSFDQLQGHILTQTNSSMNGRLSAGVTLFDGMANLAATGQARDLEEAARFSEARVEQDVVLGVLSVFLNITAARQKVTMWEETLAAQEALEGQVAIQVEAGSKPISDLYQQRASVAAARSSLVDARRVRDLAEVAMVQLLRLDPTGDYVFDPPALPAEEIRELEPNRDILIDQAYVARADLRALEARVAAEQQSIRVATAGRWPSISLSTSYGSSYNSLSELPFNDQMDRQMSGSVGLSISVPVFDRGNAGRAQELAAIGVEEAELALDDLQQQVAVEVTKAILDRDAALESLGASEAEVDASGLALEFTSSRYDAGLATLVEVTQARASLVAATTNLINARHSLAFQDQLLDYYLGVLTANFPPENE